MQDLLSLFVYAFYVSIRIMVFAPIFTLYNPLRKFSCFLVTVSVFWYFTYKSCALQFGPLVTSFA